MARKIPKKKIKSWRKTMLKKAWRPLKKIWLAVDDDRKTKAERLTAVPDSTALAPKPPYDASAQNRQEKLLAGADATAHCGLEIAIAQTDNQLRGLWQQHRPYQKGSAPPAWSIPKTVDDRAIVARLLKAYRYGMHQSPLNPESMWHTFFMAHQEAVHSVFLSGDVEASRRILANPGANKIFYGFDNLFDDFASSLKSNEGISRAYAMIIFDHLLRLAEATAAITLENPEAGPWLMTTDKSPDEIITAVERVLGFALSSPPIYPDEPGLATRRGALVYRAVHAAYQAYRLKNMSRGRSVRICEIGGGLGRTAYYAKLAGLSDYTLVDIPFTGISQGYHLLRTLGAEEVILPGEGGERGKVRLLTPDDFFALEEKFDIIINVDSLTELAPAIARRYIEKIRGCAARFLSVNHEANSFRVADLLRELGCHMERQPYWMREGYVEEIAYFD